jgi:hypothetical protein
LASINGLRLTWDAIKYFGSDSRSSHLVPISIDMIRAVQKSKSIYDKEVSSQAIADREKKDANQENIDADIKKLSDQETEFLFAT